MRSRTRGGGSPRRSPLGASPDSQFVTACNHPCVRRSVLIVDDHAGFRTAARALLEASGFDVVGDAADGRSGMHAARELRPDVVLLDIQLPDMNGFDVAEALRDEHTAIVFVSSRSASAFRWRLAANPGWRFIPKNALSGDVLAAALT